MNRPGARKPVEKPDRTVGWPQGRNGFILEIRAVLGFLAFGLMWLLALLRSG